MTLPLSYSRQTGLLVPFLIAVAFGHRCIPTAAAIRAGASPPSVPHRSYERDHFVRHVHEIRTDGGEGRIRTSEATRATDLQSVAFDRSATSPISQSVTLGRGVTYTHREADRPLPHVSLTGLEQLVYRLDGAEPSGHASPCPGAGEGIRTPDPLITNQLLCRTELRQPVQIIYFSTHVSKPYHQPRHVHGHDSCRPLNTRNLFSNRYLSVPDCRYFCER